MIEIIGKEDTFIVAKEKIEYLWRVKGSCPGYYMYYIRIKGIGELELEEEMYKQYKKELVTILK